MIMMTATAWQMIVVFNTRMTTQTSWLIVRNKQDVLEDKAVKHLYIIEL